jgi:hypothetical protein
MSINMNPTAPNLYIIIKLHKQNMPFRPISNCENVPTYELVKHLTKSLCNYVHLPNAHNVQNSIQWTADLHSMEIKTQKCVHSIQKICILIHKN